MTIDSKKKLKAIKNVLSVSGMVLLSVSMNPMSWVYASHVDHAVQLVRRQALEQQPSDNPTPAYRSYIPRDPRCYVTESLGRETSYKETDQALYDNCNLEDPIFFMPEQPIGKKAYAKKDTYYYLLPGIGDSNQIGKESQYFKGGTLETFLQQSSREVMIHQPYARWKEQNLTQQASELKDRIRAETSATSNVILIGHSMGGLRGRSVLQMGETLPQIKALVTLGTPHAGAPIIHTGPSVMTHLGVVLGGVTGYAIGLFGRGSRVEVHGDGNHQFTRGSRFGTQECFPQYIKQSSQTYAF